MATLNPDVVYTSLKGAQEPLVSNLLVQNKDDEQTLNSLDEALDLLAKLDYDGDETHLDVVIVLLRKSLDDRRTASTSIERAHIITVLATALSRRYEYSSADDDLDDGLALLRAGLSHFEDTSQSSRVLMMIQLGGLLLFQYEARGDMAVLNEAINVSRDALHLCAPASIYYCAALHNLSRVLFTRFHAKDVSEDLDECLQLARRGLECCSERGAHESRALHDLGKSLAEKHVSSGMISYSEEAENVLSSVRSAYPICHPDRHVVLSDLGYVFLMRWYIKRDFVCAEKATELLEEALVKCPARHSARGRTLHRLSICFDKRWRHTHSTDDLNKTGDFARDALAFHAPGNPSRWSMINSLAIALKLRVEVYGEGAIGELNEAAQLYREMLSVADKTHPSYRRSVYNLANTLNRRYDLLGRIDDLDESIACYRESLHYCNPTDVFRPNIILAIVGQLRIRGYRLYPHEDLEEAMTMLQDLLPEAQGANRVRALGFTGNILIHRFKDSGTMSDIHAAIGYLQQAADLCTAHEHDTGTIYAWLGESHRLCYLASGAEGNGDARLALSCFERALLEFSPNDPDRIPLLVDHAGMQVLIDGPISSALSTTLDVMGNEFAGAWKLLTPIPSFIELVGRKGLSYFLENPSVCQQVLDIHSAAIPLLTEVAFVGIPNSFRLSSLMPYDNMFATALTYGRVGKRLDQAVEILEQSRSIFWGQALHLRDPVGMLPEQLRAEFLAVVHDLEQGIFRTIQKSDPQVIGRESVLHIASLDRSEKQRRHGAQLRLLIKKARTLPGLERFMLHDEFHTLARACEDGPVVLLVANSLSCEAVILCPSGDLISVPLLSAGHQWLIELSKVWGSATQRARGELRDTGTERLKLNKKTAIPRSTKTQEDVLQNLWTNVVQPVIAALELNKSAGRDRPRLWWCCSGIFAFLPIHAAGGNNEHCSDYVVSSYTPTLGSLLRARKEFVPLRRGDVRVLLSAAPMQDLPTTVEEISAISSIIPKRAHIRLPPTEDYRHEAFAGGVTVDTILQNTPNANILHLACHGTQDAEDPLNSGFILGDGTLTIARLMPVPLPHAFLAFI